MALFPARPDMFGQRDLFGAMCSTIVHGVQQIFFLCAGSISNGHRCDAMENWPVLHRPTHWVNVSSSDSEQILSLDFLVWIPSGRFLVVDIQPLDIPLLYEQYPECISLLARSNHQLSSCSSIEHSRTFGAFRCPQCDVRLSAVTSDCVPSCSCRHC